jgi:hypothetical protein
MIYPARLVAVFCPLTDGRGWPQIAVSGVLTFAARAKNVGGGLGLGLLMTQLVGFIYVVRRPEELRASILSSMEITLV